MLLLRGAGNILKSMNYDNQPADFSLPTKFTAKRAAEVGKRKKLHTQSTAVQEEQRTAIKKQPRAAPHAEDVKTQVKSPSNNKVKKTPSPSSSPIKGEDVNVERSEMSIQREHTTIEEFKHAKTKDEIADILIDYLTSIFERAALLLVTKTHLVGWQGGGEGMHKNITNVNVPLELESVFKHVIENKKSYSGMWNPQKGDYLFYQSLEITASNDIIVVPSILNNKVFAIFYTDNYKVNPHHITPSNIEVEGLTHVSQEFSKAFLRVMKK